MPDQKQEFLENIRRQTKRAEETIRFAKQEIARLAFDIAVEDKIDIPSGDHKIAQQIRANIEVWSDLIAMQRNEIAKAEEELRILELRRKALDSM